MHGLDDLFGELEWALSVAAGDAPKKDGALELFERIFARFTNCTLSVAKCKSNAGTQASKCCNTLRVLPCVRRQATS